MCSSSSGGGGGGGGGSSGGKIIINWWNKQYLLLVTIQLTDYGYYQFTIKPNTPMDGRVNWGYPRMLQKVVQIFYKSNLQSLMSHPLNNISNGMLGRFAATTTTTTTTDQSLMVDTLIYFSFQPVLHDRFNKICCC